MSAAPVVASAPTSAPRAPRLTETRLADLELVALKINADIECLADSLKYWPKGHSLHTRFTLEHESLVRGRDWIRGKIDAERAQRANGLALTCTTCCGRISTSGHCHCDDAGGDA